MQRRKSGLSSVGDGNDPRLLITLLEYIVPDMRMFSKRGAQHIEWAITSLAEDLDNAGLPGDLTRNRLS